MTEWLSQHLNCLALLCFMKFTLMFVGMHIQNFELPETFVGCTPYLLISYLD